MHAPAPPPAARLASDRILVWDPFVRAFHWALAVAILVALVTGLLLPPTTIVVHLVAGIAAIVLVVSRTVWGFLGGSHARFAAFLERPRAVLHHLAELRAGAAPRHLGHNPLGGWMVVVLLAAILLLGVTGTLTLGGSLKSGPLAFATPFRIGEAARFVHKLLALGLLGLVLLHLGGVVFESRRTRENLAAAMVGGRKQRRPGDLATAPARPRPWLALAVAAVLLGGGTALVLGLEARPALGLPPPGLDPAYAKACGDCHGAFNPSLLPAASWAALMDGLAHHFGEDASLDPGEAAAIRSYLVANAAETWDSKPANRFRRVDPADPLRITATPFWRRLHAGIPPAVFASKAVGARSACGACHADAAAGRFHPAAIAIPETARP
jgi:cytochrome b